MCLNIPPPLAIRYVCMCVHVSLKHECGSMACITDEFRIRLILARGFCPSVTLGLGPLDEHVPKMSSFSSKP